MTRINFRHLYPEYTAVEHPDGSAIYLVIMGVGGRDGDGREYEVVLDGPAQGEKVYLDE